MHPEIEERRFMRRFDMRLPAIVRFDPERENDSQNGSSQVGQIDENQVNEVQTETQNVSARGVFFYLDRRIPTGTRCEVTLTFPPHITLTDPVRVRFIARVIRCETPLPSQRIGTAAMIEDYEFLRSSGNSSLLGVMQPGRKAAN
jgi:hypothetical protein